MQIRWMNFARIVGDDYPLVFNIDTHVLDAIDLHQQRAKTAKAFLAIFAIGRDLDLIEDRVIGAPVKKWIGGFNLVWS